MVTPRAEIPVYDATVVQDMLVSLTADRSALVGHRLGDGTEAWRRPLPSPVIDALLMRTPQGDVGLRHRKGTRVIARDDGRTLHQHERPMGDRRFLWHRRGACLFSGQCSAEIVDCETLARLTLEHGTIRHEAGFERGTRTSGCWGFDLDLLGREGDLVLYLRRNDKPKATPRGMEVVGWSASQKRARYRAALGTTMYSESLRGMSPDGRVCWLGSPDRVEVFSCATGRLRFRHATAELRHAVWASSAGIFLQDLAGAQMIDPTTGAVRWKKRIPEATVAMPTEGLIPASADFALRADEPRSLLSFDPRGKAQPAVTIPAGHTLVSPSKGGPIRPAPVGGHDHAGQSVPGGASPRLTVERFRDAGSGSGPPNRAAIHIDGELAGRVEADAWPLAEVALDDGGRAAVLMVASEPRRVRIYRLAVDPAE